MLKRIGAALVALGLFLPYSPDVRVIAGGLLYWGQGRGSKAERFPLLVLIAGGVPTIAYFIETLRAGALAYGGWVFTAGYVLAAVGEVQGLRAAPKIAHGG